jgi:hypothetical protein
MKKMVKRYSFKIGELERRAILHIRRNDINVSRFLRYSLRKLQQLLQQKYKQEKDEYVNIQIKDENDLKKYRFLLEDFEK